MNTEPARKHLTKEQEKKLSRKGIVRIVKFVGQNRKERRKAMAAFKRYKKKAQATDERIS